MRALATVLLLAAGGCAPQLVEAHNTNERIWVMSRDGKQIYRCYDMTPPGPTLTASLIHTFCQEASIYTAHVGQ